MNVTFKIPGLKLNFYSGSGGRRFFRSGRNERIFLSLKNSKKKIKNTEILRTKTFRLENEILKILKNGKKKKKK